MASQVQPHSVPWKYNRRMLFEVTVTCPGGRAPLTNCFMTQELFLANTIILLSSRLSSYFFWVSKVSNNLSHNNFFLLRLKKIVFYFYDKLYMKIFSRHKQQHINIVHLCVSVCLFDVWHFLIISYARARLNWVINHETTEL